MCESLCITIIVPSEQVTEHTLILSSDLGYCTTCLQATHSVDVGPVQPPRQLSLQQMVPLHRPETQSLLGPQAAKKII